METWLTFDAHARAGTGIPVTTVRKISENCSTIGIDDFSFGE